MQKLDAQNTLQYIIALLLHYLDELSEVQDSVDTQFAYGEKTAYVECLEILQHWENAESNGLNFDIEGIFPL
ncbi:MAG: hypothetical protein IJX30_00505 [Clostridia bacterium]|nr:hypothetical protein [Clostridia bacterium]